ncbi:MAG: hypothetical protein IPM56_16105 [Ignavibacteriales bacterium]|nr:MAG: hypothetical protein IPM56_16105 [Ignavibacteriales bacterium]
MKKEYALLVGEKVIRKSEHRGELVTARNEMKNPDAHVVTWLGRIKITDDGCNTHSDSESEGDNE